MLSMLAQVGWILRQVQDGAIRWEVAPPGVVVLILVVDQVLVRGRILVVDQVLVRGRILVVDQVLARGLEVAQDLGQVAFFVVVLQL